MIAADSLVWWRIVAPPGLTRATTVLAFVDLEDLDLDLDRPNRNPPLQLSAIFGWFQG